MIIQVYFCTALRIMDFPRSSVSKQSACNAGDPGLISGSGRSPGVGNGYPLQSSWLENPMDKGAWQATVHGVTKVLDITSPINHHHRYFWNCFSHSILYYKHISTSLLLYNIYFNSFMYYHSNVFNYFSMIEVLYCL